jgi:hypothetical protein
MMYLGKHAGLAVGLGAALFVGACSDSDPDAQSTAATITTVDKSTAQLALGELTGSVDTTVTGFNGVAPAPGAPIVSADGAGTVVRCAAGGDASVGGHVNVVPVPVLVDVNVAINYNACVTQTGTTLAGDIDFTQTVAAGVGTPLRVEAVYKGNILFSGKVVADCPVDVRVLVDEAGKAIEVSGTFCGQDATGLELQIMPRWGS